MLVYKQTIEVFAEKVGTIKIVAKTADHCVVDNHGVENIHHVRVRLCRTTPLLRTICFGLFFLVTVRVLIGHTEFSPEKTSKTKRGGKAERKREKG